MTQNDKDQPAQAQVVPEGVSGSTYSKKLNRVTLTFRTYEQAEAFHDHLIRWFHREDAPALPQQNTQRVQEIHSAVLGLRCDPSACKDMQQGFQAGVHRAAAVISQFAFQALPQQGEKK